MLGVAGSTVGLGLGVLLAMGIRALFARFGLDLSGHAADLRGAHHHRGLRRRRPRDHGGGLPARPPVRPDRTDPGAARRRGDAGVHAAQAHLGGRADDRRGHRTDARRSLRVAAEPGLLVVGGGILAALLGVASASPVIARPFLAVAAAVFRRGFGPVGQLAGQNAQRNPRRTAATASALMIGLALVSTMSIVGASAKASVDKTISENFVGDYIVSNVFGGGFPTGIADRMERVPGVSNVVRERYGFGTSPARTRACRHRPATPGAGPADDRGRRPPPWPTGPSSCTSPRPRTTGSRWATGVTLGMPTGPSLAGRGRLQEQPGGVLPGPTTLDTLARPGYRGRTTR